MPQPCTFCTGVTARVIFLTGEDEDQYEQFMLPLTAAFEAVAQMFSTNSFNEQEAKVSPSPIDWPAFGWGLAPERDWIR